jgi:enoyl-CoA hydratase
MSWETIRVEVEPPLAVVTVNRPDKLNALNARAVDELRAAFLGLSTDPGVRAVLLTGAGEKAFVAGADIRELAALTPQEAKETASRGQALCDLMENLGKPVVAAVNGYALGGGCELALACTLRVASENARFGLPEVTLGLIPGYGGTQRLPRIIGKGRALEMILTGEPVTAARALEIGLVNRVVPQGEAVRGAKDLAGTIAARGPVAVRYAAEAIHRGLEASFTEGCHIEAGLFGLLASTADMREGTSAFLEKRGAVFQGR